MNSRGFWFITLAYFDIEVSNLPNPNGLPDEATQQQDVTTIEGIELEGRVDFGKLQRSSRHRS